MRFEIVLCQRKHNKFFDKHLDLSEYKKKTERNIYLNFVSLGFIENQWYINF